MVRRSKRSKKRTDYAKLSAGLHSHNSDNDSGSSHNDSAKSDNNDAASRSDIDEHNEVERAIAKVQAEKQHWEGMRHLEQRRATLEELEAEVRALKAEARRSEDRRSTGHGAARICTARSVREDTSLPVDTFAPSSLQNNYREKQNQNQGITVSELRNIARVTEEADAELTRYGLRYDDDDERHTEQSNIDRHGKGQIVNNLKNVVSGRDDRVRDSVKHKLIWPHTRLEYTYANVDIAYGRLDPALLVAGEIGVILTAGPEERKGRLKLLQRMMYHSRDYTWNATRNFHEAILLEIERGVREWSNTDYRDVESGTLYRHPQVQPTVTKTATYQQQRQPRKYFCLDFNRGRCQHAGEHEAQVGSMVQTVGHFCSSCWRKDKSVKEHQENTQQCPNRR